MTLADVSINNKGEYGIGASAVDYSDELYTYLRITDINDDGTLNKNDLKSVDDKDAKNYLLKENDVVFARTGNSTGKAYYYDKMDGELVYAGFLIKFSLDPLKINPKFMKYYVLSEEYKGWVNSMCTGSTRPNINAKMYGNMELTLPSREQQDFLVSILDKFDKKIEINKRININLLKLSRALFKEFYMDKVESYDIKKYVTLDEVTSKFATGLNPRKNFVLGEGDNYYVTIKNMANNSIVLDDKCASITDEALVKINKRSDLQVGDLLFSGIGTIGRVHLIDEKPTNWNISESVFTMRPNELVSSEFLFIMLLSQEVQEYAKSLASGSVQKGIRMRDLKAFEFILLNEEDKSFLDSLLIPIVADIKSNEKEIIKLTKLRDTLLPKLMSGEIDVSKINCDMLPTSRKNWDNEFTSAIQNNLIEVIS